jgi:glycerol-1-phosphate dehydrogenase [NAD(P)+]
VPYASEAAQVLDGPWNDMIEVAGGIGEGDGLATHTLMETLLVSGFSMAMAGTSAPASGAEHLISHYWDMEEHSNDRPVRGLHGTQVGVGTRISGRTLTALVSLEATDLQTAAQTAGQRRSNDGWMDELSAAHPALPASIVDEIGVQLREKQRHGPALEEEIRTLASRWEEVRDELRSILVPVERIDQALEEAGCVSRASDLGVDRQHLVRTIRFCRHIRARYVNFDLLDDLGRLDALAETVASQVEEAPHG